jgi:hypothetical protein
VKNQRKIIPPISCFIQILLKKNAISHNSLIDWFKIIAWHQVSNTLAILKIIMGGILKIATRKRGYNG